MDIDTFKNHLLELYWEFYSYIAAEDSGQPSTNLLSIVEDHIQKLYEEATYVNA